MSKRIFKSFIYIKMGRHFCAFPFFGASNRTFFSSIEQSTGAFSRIICHQQNGAKIITTIRPTVPKICFGLEHRQILTVRQFYLLPLSATGSGRKRTVSSPVKRKTQNHRKGDSVFLVRVTGLEPAHREILDPKSSASANSAILAYSFSVDILTLSLCFFKFFFALQALKAREIFH